MATATRKRAQATAAEGVEVLTSTLEEEKKAVTVAGETIAIACCLPFALRFDDIPDGKGGTKSIRFPGINDNLRGMKSGVLAMPGNALCVQLPKSDWENLIAAHGKEIAFTGRNGSMPCIYPVKDVKGFKAAASEIAEMRTGLEAADPTKMGVEVTAK